MSKHFTTLNLSSKTDPHESNPSDGLTTLNLKSGHASNSSDLTHPALPALRNPNADDTSGDLLAFILNCEDVFGVAYLEKVYSRTRAIIGLAPLDPRIVIEVPRPGATPFPMFWSADGGYKLSDIDHYDITEGSGTRTLEVDDVIPIRQFDVRSPLAGYSNLFVAMNKIGLVELS